MLCIIYFHYRDLSVRVEIAGSTSAYSAGSTIRHRKLTMNRIWEICRMPTGKFCEKAQLHRGSNKSLARPTSLSIFFQSRGQVVVRWGQIRRIGWAIKTLEAQLG
jgi:hypothetical protein